MFGGLRLDLSPLVTVISESETLPPHSLAANATPNNTRRRRAVYGGVLQAFGFGANPALTPGPVEIVFSADYLTKARGGDVVSVGEFARLPAEVVLTEQGFELLVEAKDQVLPVEPLTQPADEEHPVAGALPPLSLALGLGTGFKLKRPKASDGASAPDAVPAAPVRGRLQVPPPGKPCGYLEVSLAVKRDDAELTAAKVNGRLDVALSALDFVVFYVETTEGKPATDMTVELSLPDNEVWANRTDEEGRFAFNGAPKGQIRVRLPNCTHLSAKPRPTATRP